MPNQTDLLSKFKNWSIYVILNLRGAESGFHWAIFIPTAAPLGTISHAVNRSGGWFYEVLETNTIPRSIELCLAIKIGSITSTNFTTLKSVLKDVPANGTPSTHTKEAFTCRVWVKDALIALQNAKLVQLPSSIEEIEQSAIEAAEKNRENVEQKPYSAVVINGK